MTFGCCFVDFSILAANSLGFVVSAPMALHVCANSANGLLLLSSCRRRRERSKEKRIIISLSHSVDIVPSDKSQTIRALSPYSYLHCLWPKCVARSLILISGQHSRDHGTLFESLFACSHFPFPFPHLPFAICHLLLAIINKGCWP